MSNSTIFSFVDSTQLFLEVATDTLEKTWEKTQSFSTPGCRWQAYLNQVCVDAFLPWLREEDAPSAKVWPNTAVLNSFWEVVNGTAINFDGSRLVLIPTSALDLSELRVPQEWVDIPSWVADYYVAVQVNPDDGYIRVYGYTTHQKLKTKGIYDASDRAYCLDREDLIQDLGVLWIARQLCPEETLRAAVSPLPNLPLPQAENLINRLGNASVVIPRLAVPFQTWGALLEHGGWRQRLYEQRQGIAEQWSVSQWLQAGISNFAEQFGWGKVELQPNFNMARGSEQQLELTLLSRQLTIAGKPYELRVIPKGNLESRIWRFELRGAAVGSMIPGGFKLRLLTEDLQPFENNEDIAITAVDQLYLEVAVEPGEGLVWETEPAPENCDREILRF